MTEDPVGDALLNLEHSLIQVDAARHTLGSGPNHVRTHDRWSFGGSQRGSCYDGATQSYAVADRPPDTGR